MTVYQICNMTMYIGITAIICTGILYILTLMIAGIINIFRRKKEKDNE